MTAEIASAEPNERISSVSEYHKCMVQATADRESIRKIVLEISVQCGSGMPQIVGISRYAIPLCEEIAKGLKVGYTSLCVDHIEHQGEIIGAISGVCDKHILDRDVVERLRLSPELVLNQVQSARGSALRHLAGLSGERIWTRSNFREGVQQNSEVYLVDTAILSPLQFSVAVDCLLERGMTAVVPVAPIVWKGAVLGAPLGVQRGIFLQIFNSIASIKEEFKIA
jgi:predicted phosphoribosyltransferase